MTARRATDPPTMLMTVDVNALSEVGYLHEVHENFLAAGKVSVLPSAMGLGGPHTESVLDCAVLQHARLNFQVQLCIAADTV